MPDATTSVAAARAAVAIAQASVASAVPIHPLVAPIATTGIVWPQLERHRQRAAGLQNEERGADSAEPARRCVRAHRGSGERKVEMVAAPDGRRGSDRV